MKRYAAAIVLLPILLTTPTAAETRDYICSATAVKLDEQRMEIWCADALLLNNRPQDRFREVRKFAFPTVQQNLVPQLGSQGKLLDYYLDLAQNAVMSSRKLHIWFETDYLKSETYGCDPEECRAIVALAITHLSAEIPLLVTEDDFADQ